MLKYLSLASLVCCAAIACGTQLVCCTALNAAQSPYFEIQVVDSETGRGVPLVELTTTNNQTFITDNAGRIAFHEPDLMGQEVFFSVRSHGYEVPADGFGSRGVRLTPKAGKRAEVRLPRKNVAERMFRLTGAGKLRDSQLLGYVPESKLIAGVVGQDSVQMVAYQGRQFWFWGDTSLARYPLGNFRTCGATTKLLDGKALASATDIVLDYFVNEQGESRAMMPLADDPSAKEGVVWIDGLITVPDESGRERMVCHYEHRRGLEKQLEHGIAVWNDEKQIFERAVVLKPGEERVLKGHPLRHRDGDQEFVYCGLIYPTLRVPARYEAIIDPEQYEAWTCLDANQQIVRDDDNRPKFAWKQSAKPWTPKLDRQLSANDRQLHPRDVESDKPVSLHGGSIRWNKHRQKWIAIGVQEGSTSYLGEVWYSEADALTGPWQKAAKIVTHDKYSFYNPVHHDLFDAEDGRVIYFEGTYTYTFSGSKEPTPRYDYNQILYRLDLDHPRLRAVRDE
jgi:hypothetical protein